MDSRTPPTRHDHRRIESKAAGWLARRSDAGRSWTEADQAALDAWLAESTAHQIAFLRLEMVWQRGDRLKAVAAGLAHGEVPARGKWRQAALSWPLANAPARHPDMVVRPAGTSTTARATVEATALAAVPTARPADTGLTGDALSRLQFKPRQARRRRTLGRFVAGIAAASVVLALAGLGWWQSQGVGQPVHFATARGQTGNFPLADGSRADLSADTRLDVAFSRRAREVTLHRGEAYFEVAKDARRPFSVRAGSASVTALGTRFAVREEAGVVRVVVAEGTVRLDAGVSAPRMPSAVLRAGAVATVMGGAVQVESRSVEQASQLLGWRNGELVFRSTPLGEAVAEFNRFNALQLRIHDPALAGLRVDGGFRADNAEGFVRLLEQMFPLRAVKHADRIDLHEQR